jgi:hypothetical protein
MRFRLALAFSMAFLWTVNGHAEVVYSTIANPSIIVTGVRSDNAVSDSVVVTASLNTGGASTVAALYQGPLANITAPNAVWHGLTPVFPGQTVTSSTFYGPNTSLFDPSLGPGNVRLVGSYKYAESPSGPNADHGMIYTGPVNGSGTWTQIDAAPLVAGGGLLNTIAHSTMGNLVIGNYDTTLATGNAFVYNIDTGKWLKLTPTIAASHTAYGIWQNGGSSSTHYTIAGGLSNVTSGQLDAGYLVNFDSGTGSLSNAKTFNYNNEPVTARISHFDGITGTANGFNLTGDQSSLGTGVEGGFFASVTTGSDGSFGDAAWTPIHVPGASVTSGNTVVGDHVLGIYVAGGGTHSFVAVVTSVAAVLPVPTLSAWTLIALAMLVAGLGMRVRRLRRV